MTINKKITIIAGMFILALLSVGVGLYLSLSQLSFAATGSSFNLVHEYVDGGVSGGATTTISTQIASSSPIFFTAGSTTTVTMLTAGSSDIRVNIIAHATTTAEGAGPEISIAPLIRGNNGVDKYNQTVITTAGVTQKATLIETYWIDAKATTTKTTTLSPDADNFFAGSIQISNINSPYTVFEVGATTNSDIYLELIKVMPN